MSRNLATLPGPDANQALAEYSRDPLGFMTRCAQEFGEIVPLQFDGELICLLSNPDHITEVLKDPTFRRLTFYFRGVSTLRRSEALK